MFDITYVFYVPHNSKWFCNYVSADEQSYFCHGTTQFLNNIVKHESQTQCLMIQFFQKYSISTDPICGGKESVERKNCSAVRKY